jgi:hypothetical protein
MRRRASGAGRKPLNPEDRNSAALNIRVRPDVRRALLRLAAKRERNRYLSREIQEALDSWIERRHSRPPHIEALSGIAAQLGSLVELFTRKKWSDDPFTAQSIVVALNQLMTHLDLGGVAKQPAGMDLDSPDSPKVLGKAMAFTYFGFLHIAGTEKLVGATAEFEALKRTLRKLGSRKQVLEKFWKDS